MGAFDSAEVCDLVGLYLLTLIRHLPVWSGIYRDDALCLSDLSPSDTDDVKKQIQRIYREQGLKIKINANKKVVNFLDLTLDLQSIPQSMFTLRVTILCGSNKIFHWLSTGD